MTTIRTLRENGYEDINYETSSPYYCSLDEAISNGYGDIELTLNTNGETRIRYAQGNAVEYTPEYISDWIGEGENRIRFYF